MAITRKIFSSLLFFAAFLFVGLMTVKNAQSQELNEKEKVEVRELVRETILKQPEIILEALQLLELKKQAATKQRGEDVLATQAKDIFLHPDDPVGGNPNGDVTLVEFFDYRCGYCKRVHDIVLKLVKEDGNIRYVYKEFPILGPESIFAAKAALASTYQDKYTEFSDLLMRNRGQYTKEKVFKIAETVELDIPQLEQDMTKYDGAINTIFQRNYALAQQLDITGTPGFIIGNTIIRGAAGFDRLKAAVNNARALQKKEK
ncbi:DsbA family protein [Terasakiella pusilla]|jgi:protein-disulfide isomerase|uniref:DsbA family protein n=1 Tax=Terasakiella pusilla TaxID=64973 RepID=UPI003AA999C1